MVINLGMLKDGQYDDVRSEIAAIKEACGDKVPKVIVETCLLTDEEKAKCASWSLRLVRTSSRPPRAFLKPVPH